MILFRYTVIADVHIHRFSTIQAHGLRHYTPLNSLAHLGLRKLYEPEEEAQCESVNLDHLERL